MDDKVKDAIDYVNSNSSIEDMEMMKNEIKYITDAILSCYRT